MGIFLRTDVVMTGFLLALLIECLTAMGRFCYGIRTLHHTPERVRRLTGGLRLHHGYLGIGGMAAALLPGAPSQVAACLAIGGIGLLLSDLSHHFVVLWAVTGRPQFHFFYPR